MMPNMVVAEKQPGTAWRELYPFTSHYAIVDGHRLHYVDEGSGHPLVMLHGNPTWSFYYRALITGLRSEWRVVAPDHIGCGLSDKPQDYPYRLDSHIDNIEALLNGVLKLPPFVLVLHDWGGAIGMGYAVRHPERVAGLVILNSAAFLSEHCPWRIRLCRIPGLGALLIRGLNGFARAALQMAVMRPRELSAAVRQGYLAPYDSWANRVATLRFVQDIPLSPTHPTWKTIAGIQKHLHRLNDKPMLIGWGGGDFCFDESFLQVWEQYFPGALVHRFPEAGHYVAEEAQRDLLPLMRTFLAENIDFGLTDRT